MVVDIATLEAEAERLTNELHAVRTRLRAAQIAAAPFAEGDVVVVTQGQRPPRRAIVRSVRPWWRDHYDYKVSYARKDGSWAKREETAYGEMEKATDG